MNTATDTATDNCHSHVPAARANGFTAHRCGKPAKRDGRCGVHARMVELQANRNA
jgi:hypothetical protein